MKHRMTTCALASGIRSGSWGRDFLRLLIAIIAAGSASAGVAVAQKYPTKPVRLIVPFARAGRRWGGDGAQPPGLWRRVLLRLLIATIAAGSATAGVAIAQKYPTKPVRLIVPFAPGGGTDIVARSLAQKLTDALGQSVVVDNRAGAAGTIGTETTVRATPDGYTLIMVSASYSTNAALFKLPYDPINDITPISLIGESAFMVALHPSVQAKTIKELIALAKAKPGGLNYASTGTGGITHLATELFDMMADIKMTHVPYKGTGAALSDLLGGQVQLIFGSLPSMVPQHKQGRLRGIAVSTSKRNNAVPDMPTVAETIPGYEAVLWYACWGPKHLPKDIVTRWNSEIAKAIATPEMKERLAGEGIDPAAGPPEQLLSVLKRDVPKWTKVVKQANVKQIQ